MNSNEAIEAAKEALNSIPKKPIAAKALLSNFYF